MIILLGGEKGGPGKSTLAQNLACFFAIKRQKDVLLVDADAQKTTSDWADERNDDPSLQKINCIQKQGRIQNVLNDAKARYEVIVVDVGGHDNEALRSAMTVADLMLIPVRPKRRDLKTLDHVSELVSYANALNQKMVVRTVISQAPPLPSLAQRILNAKEVCQGFELKPLNAFTYQRNVYDDIEEGGMCVFESEDSKAIGEVTAIAHEIEQLMGETENE